MAAVLSPFLEPLSELAAVSSRLTLSFAQRAFLLQLIELAMGLVFLPTDAAACSVSCEAFVDFCVCTLEQASAESLEKRHGGEALRVAHRALVTIMILCTDADVDGASSEAPLFAMREQLSVMVVPSLDEVAGFSSLQAAIARWQAVRLAEAQSHASALAASLPTEMADPFAMALQQLSEPVALLHAAAPPTATLGTEALWMQRLKARELRQLNTDALLGARRSGTQRLVACAIKLLMPLELRRQMLSGERWEEHVASAGEALDVCRGVLQLLLALPVEPPSRSHPSAELLKLLGSLLATFSLTSNLPTGSGVAQSLPGAAAAMLHEVVSRDLLPHLLLLLQRLSNQPNWYANGLLCVAVALGWALGAAVPLSQLFEPGGVLSSPPPSGATGPTLSDAGAWSSLRSSPHPSFNVAAIELLLRVVGSLLDSKSSPRSPLPGQKPAAAPTAIVIRMSGGFLLHPEYALSPEARLEQLFALRGSTMLDTIVGLLLATCLWPMEALPPSSDDGSAQEADGRIRELLLGALRGRAPEHSKLAASQDLWCARSGLARRDKALVPLVLLQFLNESMAGDARLAAQLRLNLARRHLRAHTLLLQFAAPSLPEASRAKLQLELRRFGWQLASQGLLSEQLQSHAIKSLLLTGPPGQLHDELFGFCARVLLVNLRRARQSIAGASRAAGEHASALALAGKAPKAGQTAPTTADDPLVCDVLRWALNELRAAAQKPEQQRGASALKLLPLAHMQLLLLLWHSLSEGARSDLLAQAAASACSIVASGESGASDTARVALLRLLQLVHYMLRHFDGLPSHLMPQLNAQLNAPPGGLPHAAAAAAAVSFDLNTCRVLIGKHQVAAAATKSMRPAAAAPQSASAASEEEPPAARKPDAFSAPPALPVFSLDPSEMYEVSCGESVLQLPEEAQEASASALAALADRRMTCAHEQIHSCLRELSAWCLSSSALRTSGEVLPWARQREHALVVAQLDLMAWRLLGMLPPLPERPQLEGTPSSVRRLVTRAEAVDAEPQLLLLASSLERAVASAAAEHPEGLHPSARELPMRGETVAAVSALSFGLHLTLTRAGLPETPAVESELMGAPPVTSAPRPPLSDESLGAIFRSLATALEALSKSVALHVRALLPIQLFSHADLINNMPASGSGSARMLSVLTELAGGSSAAKEAHALGEPSPVVRLAKETTSESATRASATRDAQADELSRLMVAHLLAGLVAPAQIARPPSASVEHAAADGLKLLRDEERRDSSSWGEESPSAAPPGSSTRSTRTLDSQGAADSHGSVEEPADWSTLVRERRAREREVALERGMDIERETKGESGAVARGGGESTPRAKSATPQSSEPSRWI